MGITFGGSLIGRPGSFSVVDATGMVVSTAGSFKSVAFIGEAPNLKVDADVSKVYYFNAQSTKDAQTLLGDGDLIRHMNKAWEHGADLIAVSILKPATAGAPTDAEWQTAVDRLNKTFVDGIVPLSTDGAIIAKVQAHCTTMSSVLNRRERRGFYGHKKGATKVEIKALVASANTERALFASPAPLDYMADGSMVAFDSTLTAAAMAGMWAGKEAQDPITYDYLKFPGFEVSYEAADITELLDAGIAVVEETRKGYRIVQGRTATTSVDTSEQELSVSTLKDVMSIDMREFLEEKHVGKAGVDGIEVTIYNDAMSRIKEYKEKNQWISAYVDGTLKVVKDGTTFSVDWEGKATLPVNNFLITSRFTL